MVAERHVTVLKLSRHVSFLLQQVEQKRPDAIETLAAVIRSTFLHFSHRCALCNRWRTKRKISRTHLSRQPSVYCCPCPVPLQSCRRFVGRVFRIQGRPVERYAPQQLTALSFPTNNKTNRSSEQQWRQCVVCVRRDVTAYSFFYYFFYCFFTMFCMFIFFIRNMRSNFFLRLRMALIRRRIIVHKEYFVIKKKEEKKKVSSLLLALY